MRTVGLLIVLLLVGYVVFSESDRDWSCSQAYADRLTTCK